MQLRLYQINLIGQIYDSFRQHDRVLLQLATGGGKTPICARIVADANQRGIPSLFVAHREELLVQFDAHLKGLGVASGFIKDGFPEDRSLISQIGSIQSLSSRSLPKARLIIIDEADMAIAPTYRTLLAQYPTAKVLGVTATPERLDGTGLDCVFQDLIVGPSTKWLIHTGYLSKYRLYVSEKKIDTSKVRVLAGDYSESGLTKAVDKPALRGDLVQQYKRYALDKRCIVFAVGRAHSKHVMQTYRDSGISAEHVDGDTPICDRRDIFERFRAGETKVLCNCEIATRGVDIPLVEAVQLARPTKSFALARQMIGRALRPAKGKSCAVILDHAGITSEHGFPDDPKQWSLNGSIPVLPERVKRCKSCTNAIKRSAKQCPVCGYVYEQTRNAVIPLVDEVELDEQWSDSPIPDEFWEDIDDINPPLWIPTEESLEEISRLIRRGLEELGLETELVERMIDAALRVAVEQ